MYLNSRTAPSCLPAFLPTLPVLLLLHTSVPHCLFSIHPNRLPAATANAFRAIQGKTRPRPSSSLTPASLFQIHICLPTLRWTTPCPHSRLSGSFPVPSRAGQVLGFHLHLQSSQRALVIPSRHTSILIFFTFSSFRGGAGCGALCPVPRGSVDFLVPISEPPSTRPRLSKSQENSRLVPAWVALAYSPVWGDP